MATNVEIVAAVLMYWSVSILLVFTNKVVVTDTIRAPLFVTWFQCVVTVAIAWITGRMGEKSPEGSFWKQFPKFEYDLAIAKKVAPLSLIFVGMISFNNLCLQKVEVSFYQIARSLTVCFNVVLTFAMLGQSTSAPVLAALGVVVAGFYLGSSSEVHFSLEGTLYGVASSLFVSLFSIYIAKCLPAVGGNKFKLSLYNNLNACIIFGPLIALSGELNVLAQNAYLLLSPVFWITLTITGVLGFAIGIASSNQIQKTSPLTHNISGTVKASVQTLLAFVFWGNDTNLTNILGIFVTLGGSLGYAWLRIKEKQAKDAAERAYASVSVTEANDDDKD